MRDIRSALDDLQRPQPVTSLILLHDRSGHDRFVAGPCRNAAQIGEVFVAHSGGSRGAPRARSTRCRASSAASGSARGGRAELFGV